MKEKELKVLFSTTHLISSSFLSSTWDKIRLDLARRREAERPAKTYSIFGFLIVLSWVSGKWWRWDESWRCSRRVLGIQTLCNLFVHRECSNVNSVESNKVWAPKFFKIVFGNWNTLEEKNPARHRDFNDWTFSCSHWCTWKSRLEESEVIFPWNT